MSSHDLEDHRVGDANDGAIADAVSLFASSMIQTTHLSMLITYLRVIIFFAKRTFQEINYIQRVRIYLLHTFRVNYQTYIWKNAHRSLLQLSSPVESKAWVIINGRLKYQY